MLERILRHPTVITGKPDARPKEVVDIKDTSAEATDRAATMNKSKKAPIYSVVELQPGEHYRQFGTLYVHGTEGFKGDFGYSVPADGYSHGDS